MTATLENIQAFDAFENQLKTLCLGEFPCGIGTWRENHRKRRSLIEKDKVISKFTITLKDYGPQYEKTETLERLVTEKKSPWNLDYSWSDEAKELREISVRSPWLIDEKFVMCHFKTLRIVDKGVTDVDENFLKFYKLDELTLSANFLRTINSRNLPRNLKVLELCANEISHLADLCIKPPPLIHLGLGHNKLTMIDDYLTGEYWPHLLSLDLSHNNLSDMMDIIRKLQTLPKLRNLVLQGNPLALLPAYRGYTIDSLKLLEILDDIPISADERHHYKGLTKRKEYILDEAKVIFTVDFIKGLPKPEELQNPEDQPEFPIIGRKYFVQFSFLEDRSANAQIFQLLFDDQITLSSEQQTTIDDETYRTVETEATPAELQPDRSLLKLTGSSGDVSTGSYGEKNVNFAQDTEFQLSGGVLMTAPPDTAETFDEIPDNPTSEPEILQPPPLKLAAIKSDAENWMENIELNWRKVCSRDDLLAMRDFLKQGMDIAVMEEKILSYPAEDESSSVKDDKGKDKAKDKGKDDKGKAPKKSAQSKPEKPGSAKRPNSSQNKKPKDGKDDKKKKKKGEPDIPLQHSDPEYTTVATFHIPLDDFLEGDYEYENTFVKNMAETDSARHSPVMSEVSSKTTKKDKKRDKSKEGKDGKKEKPSSAKKGKDARAKSPKAADKGKGGGKDDKKGGKGEAHDDEPPPPPPPLEVKVGFTLSHWKTANDSMKEETESNEPADGQEETAT